MLEEGLNLLLCLMKRTEESTEGILSTESKAKAVKELSDQHISENQIWKLVFLTLKLKNESLNEKIHEVFGLLIESPT